MSINSRREFLKMGTGSALLALTTGCVEEDPAEACPPGTELKEVEIRKNFESDAEIGLAPRYRNRIEIEVRTVCVPIPRNPFPTTGFDPFGQLIRLPLDVFRAFTPESWRIDFSGTSSLFQLLGTGELLVSAFLRSGTQFTQSFPLRADGAVMSLQNPGALHYWMLTTGRDLISANTTVLADFRAQTLGTGAIRSMQSLGGTALIGAIQNVNVYRGGPQFDLVY